MKKQSIIAKSRNQIDVNKRMNFIDLAKGFAMILIVFAHTMEWYSSDIGESIYVLPIIYSFHVPLFFFVSGFLFTANKSAKSFFIKIVKGFIVPYITFSVIIILSDVIKVYFFNAKENINFFEKIISLLIQKHYNVLWFLSALLIVEICAFFICKIKNVRLLIVITAVIMIFAGLYYNFLNVKLPFCLDEVLYALPFFLFGYIIRKTKKYLNLFSLRYSVIYLIIGLSINFANLRLNKQLGCVNMFKTELGNIILFFLSAVFMIMFVMSVCYKVDKIKFMNYIGKNSLVYYGLHMIPFYFIFHFLFPKLDNSIGSFILICIVSTIFVIACMTIVNIIFTKTPLCIFIGKAYSKRKNCSL